MLCRCLDRVVRGAASRDLLVVGSSSGSSILGTEKDALNNGVAQKEEESDEVEGVNGLLAGAVALTRLAEAALAAAPVLRGEDEGSEPEVGEDQVHGSQVSTISANERQDGTNEPEAQSDGGDDFLVDDVNTAVVVLVEEPRNKTSDDGRGDENHQVVGEGDVSQGSVLQVAEHFGGIKCKLLLKGINGCCGDDDASRSSRWRCCRGIYINV